jgi:hypothetical protein
MYNDLIRFEDENFEAGLDAYSRDFTREPLLSFSSYNVSMNRVQGVGPRYGITPLYTHSQAFIRATGAGGVVDYGGERQLAQTPSGVTTGVHMKKHSLGLVPIKIGSVVYYFHIFTKNDVSTGEDSTITYADCSSGIGSFTTSAREPAGGLDPLIYTQREPARSAYARIERGTISSYNTQLSNVRKLSEDVTNASVVTYTSSGKLYPANNLIGYVSDNTKAHATFSLIMAADGFRIGTGAISDMVDFKYPSGKRTITVNTLVSDNTYSCFTLKDRNIYVETVSNLTASPTFCARESVSDMNLLATPTVVARVDASGAYAASTIKYSYIENDFLRHNSAYKAIFVAAKKPICYLIQDVVNLRAYTGLGRNMFQYYPLTEAPLYPKPQATFAPTTSVYQEFRVEKRTSFYWWPSFNGSALANDAATARAVDTHVTLGAAGSGILRANRDYELTYSFFDKSTDSETNVGVPVKFKVGTADYVALSLFRQLGGPATPLQQTILGTTAGILTPVRYSFEQITDQNASVMFLNHLEIRFYYREIGQLTWFPALFMDAAKYFGDPNHDIIWACAAPIGGLPGGEPGGFNDYSPLPNDEYSEVKVFQERAFWLSANNLVFSRKRNPFAYSIYNNVSIPENKFNGMIIHQFDGESYQTSRLCIFGAEQYYSGIMKGAGYGVEVPVSLSDGSTAAYELDGSDFEVSFRYNATAFSGRAAVVANGILYFWGPKGIYRDNGVQTPEKISKDLEPDILTLYAHQYIDRIHCIYNEASREIIWFYVKNEATVNANTTWALAYHIDKGRFYNLYFPLVVDWARDLQREDSSADAGTNKLGDKRTLVAIRQTAADASSTLFYFDSLNKTGDMYPGKDLHLYKCVSQGNNIYRLFLPEAYGAAAIVGIAANDKIAICQSLAYQGSGSPLGTTSIDGIYVVNATGSGNDGSGNIRYYIDVVSRATVLPNFTAATATTSGISIFPNMIPMYHQGNNGINYVLQSRLWAPAGLKSWFLWLKGHLLFKVDLLSSASAQTTTFSYASNLSATLLANTATLTDNQGNTGYSQRVLALKNQYGATQGQAMRFKLSGSHIGGSWQLVSLAFEVMPGDLGNLKQFEE